MPKYLDLRDEISEIRNHHRKGFERIDQWYDHPVGERQEVTGLSESPHSILRKEASAFIERSVDPPVDFSGDEPNNLWGIDQFQIYRSRLIFQGIGAEILLNAIVLKHDPDYYIEKMETNESPSVDVLRNRMIGLLGSEIDQDQRERIDAILELLKTHRNNLVHLSFHQMSMNKHPPRILEVLAFLLAYFFSPDLDIVTRLRDRTEELDEMDVGLEYEPIVFPIG